MRVGDQCPKCLRLVTQQVLDEKYQRKADNARASVAKAKISGKLGRPKIRNDIAIKNLRAEGRSIRDIAATLGISTNAVQKGLK